MSKFPSVSATRIIRALRQAGYADAPKRGKGSHRALVRTMPPPTRIVIVPAGKDIPRGTVFAIITQAGLDRDEFIALL